MENITLNSYPDTNWLASNYTKYHLCESLKVSNAKIYLEVQYLFNRDYPESQQNVQTKQSVLLNSDEIIRMYSDFCGNQSNNTEIKGLNSDFCVNQTNCSFNKPGSINQIIRLLSTGSSLSPILIENENFNSDITLQYIQSSSTDSSSTNY